VDQHLAESTKRGRGERGPDKRARKPRGIPLEGLDPRPGETPLEDGTPTPLEPLLEAEPAFDEETARALVEIGVGLLNDAAGAIVRAVAKKETGDDQLADAAAQEIRMSEKIDSCISKGAVACAKKYAVRLDYAPEFMLLGGLVVWGGQVSLSVKTLKAKGAEIRARARDAKEAA